MKLPNSDQAIIPREKIEGYLLSPIHPVGRHKAVFFNSLGYTQDEWQTLERDIRLLLFADAQLTEKTEYGRKYEIRATITGPNNHSAAIISAWIIPFDEEFPRFITAYPED